MQLSLGKWLLSAAKLSVNQRANILAQSDGWTINNVLQAILALYPHKDTNKKENAKRADRAGGDNDENSYGVWGKDWKGKGKGKGYKGDSSGKGRPGPYDGKPPYCPFCSRIGHTKKECWYAEGKFEGGKGGKGGKGKNIPKYKPNYRDADKRKKWNAKAALECEEVEEPTTEEENDTGALSLVATESALKSVLENKTSFVVDSGASRHIVDVDTPGFTAHKKTKTKFNTANGTMISDRVGEFVGSVNGQRIKLANVCGVKNLRENLFSVRQAVAKGARVSFASGKSMITLAQKKIPLVADGGVYKLTMSKGS